MAVANLTQNSTLKIQHLALALLVILYIAVALAHAYLAPLTIGPGMSWRITSTSLRCRSRPAADHPGRASPASYKSDQPPLYHLMAAALPPAALVDPGGPPYLKPVQDDPRRQLIERTRHAWGLYNTLDEQWPYRGKVLRWQIGRWVAILFGAATVASTFFVARGVFAGIGQTTRPRRSSPITSETEAGAPSIDKPGNQGSSDAQSKSRNPKPKISGQPDIQNPACWLWPRLPWSPLSPALP